MTHKNSWRMQQDAKICSSMQQSAAFKIVPRPMKNVSVNENSVERKSGEINAWTFDEQKTDSFVRYFPFPLLSPSKGYTDIQKVQKILVDLAVGPQIFPQ